MRIRVEVERNSFELVWNFVLKQNVLIAKQNEKKNFGLTPVTEGYGNKCE